MPVMKEKLVQDFFEAVEVDKLMTKGQLDLETGVPILKDMIQYVRNDIGTMDEETKKVVDKEIIQLDEQNAAWKDKKEQEFGASEDDIDERNFKLSLLRADHKKYQQELLFIQNLAYRKGWFD